MESYMQRATEAVRGATEKLQEAKTIHERDKARMDELELKIARQNVVMPGNPWQNKSYGETKMLPEEDKAFLNWVRTGREQKALVLDSTGQILVSQEILGEIQRAVAVETVIEPLCQSRTISKDRISVRNITEATVAFGRLETGSVIPEADLTPSDGTIYVEDIYGLTKLGEDELEDSDYNLAQIIADSFGRKVAELKEWAYAKGRGHAFQEPNGITLDPTLVAATCTTGAVSVVTIEDFLQMVYACPPAHRKNGTFVVSSATEWALRSIRVGGSTTTDGPFAWQPSVAAGKPDTFLGYPIVACDYLDSLSDVAGIIGIFGNFKAGYLVVNRQDISVQRLNELYSEAGLIGFKLHCRIGGGLLTPSDKRLVLLQEHSA
jgi:HK97 family phage major capsid protein